MSDFFRIFDISQLSIIHLSVSIGYCVAKFTTVSSCNLMPFTACTHRAQTARATKLEPCWKEQIVIFGFELRSDRLIINYLKYTPNRLLVLYRRNALRRFCATVRVWGTWFQFEPRRVIQRNMWCASQSGVNRSLCRFLCCSRRMQGNIL